MDSFVMEIAGAAFEITPLFETTSLYCRAFLTDRPPEYRIVVRREDLEDEQMLLDVEADEEGLKRRRFSEPFLERSVIQRKAAQMLTERKVILMHGSTVAVDGRAYLFTAACGTGKSTHTRLWREVFGDRAVMVNDDKPFLRFVDGSVLAYGSPWTGKHGLGGNVCVPLAGICILKRGAKNAIRRCGSEELYDFLLHQMQPEGHPGMRELLAELVLRVPVWQMECNKDQEAARVSFSAMSGEVK